MCKAHGHEPSSTRTPLHQTGILPGRLFETMTQIIRAREMAFQGSINPMLKNFGESSEASQYTGRAVSDNWPCPYHAHKQDGT